MSIDFHQLMEPININRLIFIDYIDYIDCFPMIDFHRLGRPGTTQKPITSVKSHKGRRVRLGDLNCKKVIFRNIRTTSGRLASMRECVQVRMNEKLKNGALCGGQKSSRLRVPGTVQCFNSDKERNARTR